MNLFKKLFIRSETEIASSVGSGLENGNDLLNDFLRSSSDNKIKKIIAYAETADLKYYELFKYAILSDSDKYVKFAALKRLYKFSAHPDCIPMITGLKYVINVTSLEPYYSMALSNMKLITIEEFKALTDHR